MFTKTTLFHKPGEGGGSGGDQHNLGWYATPDALRTAHATATAGDWAIVGSTDTVWIWDTDTNAWKDSDQKGQVASVNGQTGTVVLTASDVGAATAAQGALADTAIQSVKTINGQSIVGTGDVTVGGLPDQTDQSGKFLTTDGTDASWATVNALQNTSLRPNDSLTILGTPSTSGYTNNINIGSGSDFAGSSVFIGYRAKKSDSNSSSTVCIGSNAKAGNWSVAIGCSAAIEGSYGIAYSTVIGGYAKCTQSYSMQFGRGTNSEEGTVCFGTRLADSTWVNYKLLDRDGTIPAARHAALPSADGTYVLKLVIANGVPTLSWVAE